MLLLVSPESAVLATLGHLLGDYARQTPPETLLARLVMAVETEEGWPLAETVVKQMTGGDWRDTLCQVRQRAMGDRGKSCESKRVQRRRAAPAGAAGHGHPSRVAGFLEERCRMDPGARPTATGP